MISDDDLAELLAPNHEQRGVEFKGPGPITDKHLFAKITRACIGMTNRRDGGIVLVGVDDKAPTSSAGLSEADIEGWCNYDDLSDMFGSYSDPPIQFEGYIRQALNNAKIFVIEVFEFTEIPTLCKKDFQGVLEKGKLYLRSHHKPETTSRPAQVDMRELVDLATEKGVRRFVERARRAGMELQSTPTQRESNAERFLNQLGELA